MRNPVGCTSTGRTITGRDPWEAAAPAIARSVYSSPSPTRPAAISSRTPSSPSTSHASCSAGSSQAPVARSDTPRGPVRRSTPRMTSSQPWNNVAAYGPWASSKKVASAQPVPSSRVTKTTRRPERIGGVWVATLTPATSTSASLRQGSISLPRAGPPARRDGAQLAEEPPVEVDDVPAGVQAEHLQLGADQLGVGELGQPAAVGPVGGRSVVVGHVHAHEVEAELAVGGGAGAAAGPPVELA